jgi:hypothetical protein
MAKKIFPPIPTKFEDSIGTSLLVNIPKFQAKKWLEGHLLPSVFDQKMSFYQWNGG